MPYLAVALVEEKSHFFSSSYKRCEWTRHQSQDCVARHSLHAVNRLKHKDFPVPAHAIGTVATLGTEVLGEPKVAVSFG